MIQELRTGGDGSLSTITGTKDIHQQKQMMDILRRFEMENDALHDMHMDAEQPVLDDSVQADEMDPEEYQQLLDRFDGVDLRRSIHSWMASSQSLIEQESFDNLWNRLTDQQRQRFQQQVEDPEGYRRLVQVATGEETTHAWTPWWTIQSSDAEIDSQTPHSGIIDVEQEALLRTQAYLREKQLLSGLPALPTLTLKNVNERVLYNWIDLLFAFAYVERYTLGDAESIAREDPRDLVAMLWRVSAVLEPDQAFRAYDSASEAFILCRDRLVLEQRAAEGATRRTAASTEAPMVDLLCQDVLELLSSRSRTERAIFQFTRLWVHMEQWCQRIRKGEQSIFQPDVVKQRSHGSTEPSELDPENVVRRPTVELPPRFATNVMASMRKMLFYCSYVRLLQDGRHGTSTGSTPLLKLYKQLEEEYQSMERAKRQHQVERERVEEWLEMERQRPKGALIEEVGK